MINVSNITKELYNYLKDHPNLADFKKVDRASSINLNMRSTPWLGVYRARINYNPHTIGTVRNWKGLLEITLLMQVASLNGESAEDETDLQLNNVLSALVENKTINNLATLLASIDCEYQFNEEMSEDFIYQQVKIVLTYEVRTSG